MKNLTRYFQESHREANEDFLSADGGFADDSFAGDDLSFADNEGFYADGGPQQAPATSSQPYIVNVVNTTTNDIANVTILGANTNVLLTAPAYGNTTGISITMGIANQSYSAFLFQTVSKPFATALTYIVSSSDNQVLETLTLVKQDSNGNVTQLPMIPTVDPYQQQSNRIAFTFNYTIDGNTSIVISNILAKSGSTNGNAKLYFYPSETVSTTRVLSGNKQARGYSNPGVVKGTKIQLTSSAKRALGR